jgi:hypothetical protein
MEAPGTQQVDQGVADVGLVLHDQDAGAGSSFDRHA